MFSISALAKIQSHSVPHTFSYRINLSAALLAQFIRPA